MRERKTETEENIQQRLRIASEELEYGKLCVCVCMCVCVCVSNFLGCSCLCCTAATSTTFDHVVVNDSVDVAYKDLKEAVAKVMSC